MEYLFNFLRCAGALIQRRCNSPLTALIIQGTALRERNRGLPI
ncbi:hypothetical protein ALO54_101954 [Pseudomonas syringae pv. philadelphi]|nr:Unknown protein sequence [Pseudomonas syringae pv. maculicola]KPW48657.1 hypothetical protein ALO86_101735 [Pseudomonas syringae pv. berberidis]KPY27578.1 hypothetical protein ALO54_101954 [Pseudomonas syringae pv. philadelphi]RMM15512.1 hypothetical protein ALQ83_102005 [Pseudomonas syringae pv. berberidis]RMQ43159.1 hypothetical protein ALQ06_101954 [Pseudomonas syringae pv. berberidis]